MAITKRKFLRTLKDPKRAQLLQIVADIRANLKQIGFRMERAKLDKEECGFGTRLTFIVSEPVYMLREDAVRIINASIRTNNSFIDKAVPLDSNRLSCVVWLNVSEYKDETG